jgi:hypothetical protein
VSHACRAIGNVKNQGKNLNIERNRARKGASKARRFHVSPVTRAIRSVLTVSAAALAFSGTGLAFASTAAPQHMSPMASQRADLAQHAGLPLSAPVVDLTVVGGDIPASVLDAGFDLQSALADGERQVASVGDMVAMVADLTTVSGPGNAGGPFPGDVVQYSFVDPAGDFWGQGYYMVPNNYSKTISSTSGMAIVQFIDADRMDLYSTWTMDVTGYTFAAGIEFEAGTDGLIDQRGAITSTTTGMGGQAYGLYVAAGHDATIINSGAMTANATGAYGIATAAFAFGDTGAASVYNTGTLDANATNGGTAFGMHVASNTGTATGHNESTGSITVNGTYATGIAVEAFGAGQATGTNDGQLHVYGDVTAYGMSITSDAGNAIASNNDYVLATANGLAVGMQADGANGFALNQGTVIAFAYSGSAEGVSAFGGMTNVTNDIGAFVGAYGLDAVALNSRGDAAASATNHGDVYAWAVYDATGIVADSRNGRANATNAAGAVQVYAIYGDAIGIDVQGANYARAQNNEYASLTVYSREGIATGLRAGTDNGFAMGINYGTVKVDGIVGVGIDVHAGGANNAQAQNQGTLGVSGVAAAYGIYALSDAGTAIAVNAGDLSVSANGTAAGMVSVGASAHVIAATGDLTVTSANGFALGAQAYGDFAFVNTNPGLAITVDGAFAMGVDAEALYGANLFTSANIVANGDVGATGAQAYSAFGGAIADNGGTIRATTVDGAAYGMSVYAAGDATTRNFGYLYATSVNGDAVGLGNIAGGVSTVTNVNRIQVDGGTAGVGVLAVGGTVAVHNNGGLIDATAHNGDGFAAGVLAIGGNVDVDNDGNIVVRGTYATGIDVRATGDASAQNDSRVTAYGGYVTGMSVRSTGDGAHASATNSNFASVTVSGTGAISGIEAVARGFEGTASVVNDGSVTVSNAYATLSQGLVAAGDLDATITNNNFVRAYGGSASYGALALSADGTALVTNDGMLQAQTGLRGGTAFGAVAQSSTGLASVDNNNFIQAIGSSATGAYATAQWHDTSIDNSGTIFVIGNAGNTQGALAYSYLDDAHVTNSGDVSSFAYVSGTGLQALTIYGDASVENAAGGDVYVQGGTRARGAIARSLLGNASLVNDSDVTALGGASAFGIWARADYYGTADVVNTGSVYTNALASYGAIAGGAYGATLDNSGAIYSRGWNMSVAATAYSGYGDASLTNDGSLTAQSGNGAAYGVQVFAGGTATVVNNASHFIGAYAAAVADGIYASGASVDVVNDGIVVAHGGNWAAGIEARGVDATLLNTGTINALVDDGAAFGMFALVDDVATVRNNGDIFATATQGNAYGEFVIADTHAITTNGGEIFAAAMNGAAYGVVAMGADVDSTNDDTITAEGGFATGMLALGNQFHAVTINHGDIAATAHAAGGVATGIYVGSVGYARVVNNGNVDAHADDGTAYGVYAVGDLTVVRNSATGLVEASAQYGTAIGVYAGGNVGARVDNSYGIRAHSNNGSAFGAMVYANDDASFTENNTGWVTVGAYGSGSRAVGVLVGGDNASVTNGGTIGANNSGRFAMGIQVLGDTSATIDNTGIVSAHQNNKYGGSSAIGMLAGAYGDVTVDNGGWVYASGGGDANGIVASSGIGQVTVTNSGDVEVTGPFTQFATGIYANSGDGNVSIDNTGDILVGDSFAMPKYGNATTGYSVGAEAFSYNGNASITNGGGITVLGAVYGAGAMASSVYGDASVTNTHDIDVDAGQFAIGAGAQSEYGHASVSNAGAIVVIGGDVALGAAADGHAASVVNTGAGTITVTGYNTAIGIDVAGTATATATNAGMLDVTAHYNATGINAFGYGAVTVGNAGTLHATAAYGWATGIEAIGDDYYGATTVTVDNTGTMAVTADNDWAEGVFATGNTVSVGNALHGSVTVDGLGWAMGLEANGDTVTVDNDGALTVSARGTDAYAAGMEAFAYDALAITNAGDIHATATDGSAKGVAAYGYGTVDVGNIGHVTASGAYYAIGVDAEGWDAAEVTIANAGTVTATATDGFADAIFASGPMVDVGNTGHLVATASGWAAGIEVSADTATITNGNDIRATSVDGYASGIFADGDAVTVANTGTIAALSTNDTAHGINVYAATVDVTNRGTIGATGYVAVGIEAYGDDEAAIDNRGTVNATGAYATGLRAFGDLADVGNTGTIRANGDVVAFGAIAQGGTVSLHNGGSMFATTTDVDGYAIGALALADDLAVANTGTIASTVTGDYSQAIGVIAMGGDVAFSNTGTIRGTSSTAHSAALGALVGAKYGDATIVNSGLVTATGTGGGTMGMVVESAGDVAMTNSGTISATDGAYAIALGLYADGISTLTNTGTIIANSHFEGSVAIAGGNYVEDVRNAGNITGALMLGAGDDVFSNQNHGTWIVRGTGSDFGDGNDRIANALGGTIVMNGAALSMGDGNNTFANAGIVGVNGESSIDMGPGLFTNTGTISFLDGAPDDLLTIHGDFAGSGALNVDVSLLNQTGDMLYIDGDVVDGTRQALNVRVLDLPNSVAGFNIPIVTVSGTSKTGEFVPGTFTVDRVLLNANNFVNVKVAVTERINTANSTADLFSLTVAMDGVNDTGALAGDIATGAQGLMAAQVGTFRQRMGVFTRNGESDTGAWVRVFGDKGTIAPEFRLDNMPQNGRFSFDQTNAGVEAGLNVPITDGFVLGAMVAQGRGKQTLNGGFGSDDIDGNTIGASVTYLAPTGFYADVSYRWMHFDAELRSAGGRQETEGDISAFNAEAGWQVWTSGDFKVVPQVQFTRSTVGNIDALHGDLAAFEIDGGTSSRVRAGVELERTFTSASGATWTPYGVLSAVREFQGENRFTIADSFTGMTSTEGTSAMVEFGANVKMGQLDFFGGLNWTDGGAFDSVIGGQVGLRYTW